MKMILIVLVVILAAAAIVNGVMYFQQRNDIASLQTQLNAVKGDINTLTNITSTTATNPGQTVSTTVITQASQTDSSAIIALIPKIEPVVVRIDVSGTGFQASGSGFIIDSAGYVMTNQHVIDSATSINVTLQSGQQIAATVTAQDSTLDLAIIKLNSNVANLPVTPLGTMNDVVLGEDVIACGFPLGLDLPGPASVTRGIVSAIRTIDNVTYIQTDVTINPGNSGGGLFTVSGKMIGITTAAVVPAFVDAENVGLAIPIDILQKYINANLKK
jgi:serine protease Do